MAARRSSLQSDCQIKDDDHPPDRLKSLYSSVNEEESPLPRQWSSKDKYNFIGLSQNNLRVHYKGVGKTHKDAASVRATQPIPASCGIYYFEVKIISKGRDGYMGIGLSVQGVNLNRLPGWDTHSYGYHGDDGHSFCSSGTGQPYGPTFTTGDVIGCCINLIENTCFYTKNGVHLGIAFRDLPPNLYPTVGLQTPGEIVEANFGQSDFVYDIEDYMREWRLKTKQTIERFPVPESLGEWQAGLNKIVSTYLVHYGYCGTAESFARSTQQSFDEELSSIKHRQQIQRLVLAGRMGEAIDKTRELYPGVLERNPNLLFSLKCRQFIEMVNGTDSQVRPASMRSPKSLSPSNTSPVHLLSPTLKPPLSTSSSQQGSNNSSSSHVVHRNSPHSSPHPHASTSEHSTQQHIITPSKNSPPSSQQQHPSSSSDSSSEQHMNNVNLSLNGSAPPLVTSSRDIMASRDTDMDTSEEEGAGRRQVEKNGFSNGCSMNGASHHHSAQEHDMETDQPPPKRQFCGGSQTAIERMIQFGRELRVMCEKLKREYGASDVNEKALKEAASMLAYSDPWSSPVGYQLDPVQREPVCAALNSAILESHGLAKQPALEVAIGQVHECMRLMSRQAIASCAFANLTDYIQ